MGKLGACQIREQDTSTDLGGHQSLHQLASGGAAQVDRNGALALIEPSPIQASTAWCEWQAAIVDTPADWINSDHVRTKLGER